jgi:hypothetical protein
MNATLIAVSLATLFALVLRCLPDDAQTDFMLSCMNTPQITIEECKSLWESK